MFKGFNAFKVFNLFNLAIEHIVGLKVNAYEPGRYRSRF
jgi:hypothetical protein